MNDVLKIERNVLGALVLDENSRDQIDYLSADDFLDSNHKRIISAMKELVEENEGIDYLSVYQKSQPSISLSFLTDLTNEIATTVNIENLVRLLKDKAARRNLLAKLDHARELLSSESDILDIKTSILTELENIKTSNKSEEVMTLKDAMLETIQVLERRSENKDDKSYHTGIKILDHLTAGLHPEELTTIAARPGAGKSVLGVQIGLQIASNKRKVLFTSLEMSSLQLCQRIISANSDIDGNKLRRGDLKDDDWKQAFGVATRFAINNFMLDRSSKKPQDIRAKIRKLKPELVIIDYLQLLQPDSKHSSREQEVSSITRSLKLMSLEFKIPIIMLSQLNRNAEGKRPTFADLRESGAIEQDSDNILFIHKLTPDELERHMEEGKLSHALIREIESRGNTISALILEKQRNGPTADFGMILVPKLMRFISLDK